MIKKKLLALLLILAISAGCSKKHLPQNAVVNHTSIKKGPWPKVLTLDDRIAKRVPDGRLYFDLEGKRYWKNYKDGKYYLFNKSMYDDPAFKPKL